MRRVLSSSIAIFPASRIEWEFANRKWDRLTGSGSFKNLDWINGTPKHIPPLGLIPRFLNPNEGLDNGCFCSVSGKGKKKPPTRSVEGDPHYPWRFSRKKTGGASVSYRKIRLWLQRISGRCGCWASCDSPAPMKSFVFCSLTH